MLSGPPGTGKTTLAHIVAKHCGYRPYEVNASDDRSTDRLKEILHSALQSQTLHGDKSPNCVILDEIDGIDNRQTVDMILHIVKEPLKTQSASSGGKHIPLTRPLICICNDLYSANLRELRKHATIFQFSPPTELRLVQRLKQICSSESLNVSGSLLTQLCHATGNDIRSAINTLQFASLRSQSIASLPQKQPTTIRTSNSSTPMTDILQTLLSSGLKDELYDVFHLWKLIFHRRELSAYLTKRKLKTKPINTTSSSNDSWLALSSLMSASSSDQVNHCVEIMNLIQQRDDIELICSGLFHNRLKVSVSDPLFLKTWQCSDWFSFADQFSGFNRYVIYLFIIDCL